jgi:hypothetical protein
MTGAADDIGPQCRWHGGTGAAMRGLIGEFMFFPYYLDYLVDLRGPANG